MERMQSELSKLARQRIGNGLQIIRVEDGLIFEHRNASHFLAEIDLRATKITVPVTAEFRDHPEYDGDELVERGLEAIAPSLEKYRQRGYEVRETEFQPAYNAPVHGEADVPIFIAYVERHLEGKGELLDELPWLLEQLPTK